MIASAQKQGDARRIAAMEERMRRFRYATQFPPYFYVKSDAAGNLWVQEYHPLPALRKSWSVFDTSGIFLGDVEMPGKFQVFEIGEDYVLGNWRDELDIEHVRLYRIVKPKAR
jgi:hypothetical protein